MQPEDEGRHEHASLNSSTNQQSGKWLGPWGSKWCSLPIGCKTTAVLGPLGRLSREEDIGLYHPWRIWARNGGGTNGYESGGGQQSTRFFFFL